MAVYRPLAMQGVQNLYWLHNGMAAWQQMIEREEPKALVMAGALGAEQPGSRPPAHGQLLASKYIRKIKRPGGGAAKSGGCGG